MQTRFLRLAVAVAVPTFFSGCAAGAHAQGFGSTPFVSEIAVTPKRHPQDGVAMAYRARSLFFMAVFRRRHNIPLPVEPGDSPTRPEAVRSRLGAAAAGPTSIPAL